MQMRIKETISNDEVGMLEDVLSDLSNKKVNIEDIEEIEPMILKTPCIICGNDISGTVGKLINIVPICEDCKKTRKHVKRGIK